MNKKENNIIIRIEKDKKELFQKIVENEGLTISKVLSAFIEDTCTNGKISENIANNLKIKKVIINIPLIKKTVKEVIDSMNKEVIQKVYLFGSYARGEATSKSDIDLRVLGMSGLSLFDIGYIVAEIEERLNKKVDIISGNNIEPVVYETIQKDEICIYEK